MNAHGVWLEIEQSYSLPQLRDALVKVLGEDSTELILRLVYLKMEELAEDARDSEAV